MRTVNMHEAKTHLSRLVRKAVEGEPFIIARAGKPLVRVTAMDAETAPKKSRIGFLDGQFQVPDDFDTMFADEIQAMFEGKHQGALEEEPEEEDEKG